MKQPAEVAEIKLGYECNNNCIFCLNQHMKGLGRLGSKESKEAIDRAKSLKCKTVVFTGGEPSIRPDFLELCTYARKLGLGIQIQTNGRKFSEKGFAERVSGQGIELFVVSAHAHNAGLHKLLTGTGSFNETVKGIKNIVGFGNRVVSNTVIVKQNMRHLKEIAKMLLGLGVERVQLTWPEASGAALANFETVVPRLSRAMPFVRQALFGERVCIAGIPLCIVGKEFEGFCAVRENKVDFDFGKVCKSTKERREKERAEKPALCSQCAKSDLCDGICKQYLKKIGSHELKTIPAHRQRVTHF